jgi:hypothetical protein
MPLDLGANVDAHHHCNLCRLGSSLHYFGASHSIAPKQGHSNTTHYLPYRASGKRMRVRISAHPLARSLGPLALGPLHFEDAQEFISRKHGELGVFAT